MKRNLTLLFFAPVALYAQQYQAVPNKNVLAAGQLKQAEMVVPVASFEAVKLYTKAEEVDIVDLVSQQFPVLQNAHTGLILTFQKTSKLGTHYVFQQTYKGIPVYKATCNITVNANGVVLSSFNTLVSTEDWTSETFTVNTVLGKPMWIVSGQAPIAAYQKTDGTNMVITDATGTAIAQKVGAFYYAVEDTMVSGKVFLPDPLTSQAVVYGKDKTYQHFNDSDYALLNNQRKDVQFPATFNGSVFTLENQYAKVMNLYPPNIAPATSVTPTFNYLRSQTGFKDVMAFYHIYQAQMYFQSLGFNELKNYKIKVDAHSGTGDNSSFNYSSDTSLNFGTGGVPDAEDGDIPTHEYTHALSWFLNPTPNMSNERRAMEEAICDIIATTISKRYTPFNWRLFANFDAPNPITSGLSKFWGGRNCNSTKTYENKENSPYPDSEIWSSAILDIAEHVGNDRAVTIMLNTIYSMPENCTMPQAAILYWQADSILFNQKDIWAIADVFNTRKLGNFYSAVSEQTKILRSIVIQNSADFAAGIAAARVEVPFKSTYTITDIQGKVVTQKQSDGAIELNPQDFTKGMYIITIETENGQASLKFVR